MSFYGKVFYQLENAFAKILIKNNGKNTLTAPDTVGNSNIPAVGLNSEFTLDSGNKWIKLEADNNNYNCKFYHSLPAFDEANDSNFTTMNISSETGETVIELTPGQQIKIQNLKYDKAGHISKVEDKYFKLPITELDADLETIESNISNLQQTVGEHTTAINKNKTDISSLDGKYDSRLDALEAADVTINENIASINNKIGTISNMGLGDNAKIANAIGNLNDSNLLVEKKSVVENLIEMIKKINENTATITSTNFALKGVIDNLLKELEKNNIIINSEDIWKT